MNTSARSSYEHAGFVPYEARQTDAAAIATIHIEARRVAMPYLPQLHTAQETREWFASIVGDRPGAWWIARSNGQVVGYMLLDGEDLDHLYVHPSLQGQGVGSSLLQKAKSLSPNRLVLWTFQQNTRARAFYEARGFRIVAFTDGRNEEGVPDVQYEWQGPGALRVPRSRSAPIIAAGDLRRLGAGGITSPVTLWVMVYEIGTTPVASRRASSAQEPRHVRPGCQLLGNGAEGRRRGRGNCGAGLGVAGGLPYIGQYGNTARCKGVGWLPSN